MRSDAHGQGPIVAASEIVRRVVTDQRPVASLLRGVVGAFLVGVMLANAVPVAAHAFVVQTTPRAGERLASGPPAVQLRFSEPVVTAQLAVSRAAGDALSHSEPRRTQGGLSVEVALGELSDGIYVVAYEAVAEDAHVTAGEFAFAVGEVDDPATFEDGGERDVTGAGVSWWQALARSLLVAGLLLAFGALISERFVWRRVASHAAALPRLPVAWFAGLGATGAVASLLLLLFSPAAGAGDAELAELLLSVPAISVTTQLLLIGVAGQLLLLPPEARQWAVLPLGLALGIAASTGHPASHGLVQAAVNVVHLGAVALWTGGLVHVALVVWRFRAATDVAWVRRGVARYATGALAVVGVVIVSGVVLAVAQFDRPGELLDTSYGRVLLAKVIVVAIALALALVARMRGLGRDRPLRAGVLSRVTRLEAVALVAALGLASIVASVTPPSAVRGASYLLGPPPLDGPVLRAADLAGSMAVHLAAAPGRVELRALGFSGEGIDGAELRVEGEREDGVGLDLQPRDCGPGCWTTALTWRPGTTVLRAQVSAPDWHRGSAKFEVSWPPEPEAPERLEAVIEAMRTEPRVVMIERVTSGPGMSGDAHTFRDSGEEFLARELYATGGATDVHPVPPRVGAAALTLYLPGSSIWFRLELDERDRIVAETIVSPGHLIERTFSYPEQ